MKIGYFKHWSQPSYTFIEFAREQGVIIEEIDYKVSGYLEKYDVVLVEQNGFNDYIENDEPYIADWVKRGGIFFFMHQDYQRWAPGFLPAEIGYTQLIHRHIPTINEDGKYYMSYLAPWIEEAGRGLFHYPEEIAPEELIDWNVPCNSFRIVNFGKGVETKEILRTTAQSCYLFEEGWEVLGSYMDPAVRNGALILRCRYGKGMYFMSQLLFPEEKMPENDRCLAFWKKYLPNLLSYFERFLSGTPEPVILEKKEFVRKKNYKLAIHMHSLDWYGCDSAPGTIHAMMRYLGFDICALALKDTGPYRGKLDARKYSDDKVLFLDGQEYHPFNWKDRNDSVTHNCYHMLPIGIDPDAYTPEFTRSLYGDEEVDAYLKRALDYAHSKNAAVCATHPNKVGYWQDYDFDAVDNEPLCSLVGTHIEKAFLAGKRIAVMNSVDLFGFRRFMANPAVNFIYLNGETPSRESVVKAIRNHHTIAGLFFKEADVTLNDHIPGDVVTKEEASNGILKVSAEITRGLIREVRVYCDGQLILTEKPDKEKIDMEIRLENIAPERFVRLEASGDDPGTVLIATPFFVK